MVHVLYHWGIPIMWWLGSLFFIGAIVHDWKCPYNANDMATIFAVLFGMGGTLMFIVTL